MKAINIKIEHLYNPIGIDIDKPLITWNCEGGTTQTAYEIKAFSDGKEIWTTGKEKSCVMQARFEGKLNSRQRVDIEIILFDENDNPGELSKCFFEMGLLDNCKDWCAKWINPEVENLLEVNKRPASYLKKSFTVTSYKKARLYITAHGLYTAFINGERVSDHVLSPGTSEYDTRLEYQTVDVTSLVHEGDNEICVILGDGWYRGKSGMNNTAGNLYGNDISLLAQLEVDEKVVCITDETWKASQDGPIRANGLDFGERVDARYGDGVFAIDNYHLVKTENFGYEKLVCSNNVSIREKETFKGKLIVTPKGEKVIDFGQNIAGYTSFSCNAKKGAKIRLVHGESLDKDGNFTIDNFQHESMDPAKMVYQETDYICKEGENVYKPLFAIFGFQYMLVESDIPVEDIDFTAIAVYSDMEVTGHFECGNADVNKLFNNSLWSMKGNFCDIPTDCPTRERQGWTGDAAAFVPTGVYLMDCYPVLRKWLNEVRSEQLPDGKIPGVAPKSEVPGKFKLLSDGSAGWADAIGIVPGTLASAYNCTDILEENYEAFKKWVDFTAERATKSRLKSKFKSDKHKKYIVDTGFHWGEWLEPGVDSKAALTEALMKGAPEVPTAYYAYSSKLLSDAAKRLGKTDDAEYYANLSENVKEAYRAWFVKTGKIVSDRQASYVRPIALDVINDDEKKEAAETLNKMVIENGYHLNTGFLSTPFLCHVLTEYGYTDTAYKLLLQDTAPSWLYAVKKGATTIWETWDGKREDGTVHDSLNHYSYGAISGWLFKDVAGINLNYGKITIKPHPNKILGFASASYSSPIGMIKSSWKAEGDSFSYEIEIPSNTKAYVTLPGQEEKILTAGKYCFESDLTGRG
ncbi:MAG: glycoside hydrolase family 78 protein [Butyrivibrio sp.]|nr:glycoside hydrolase family 78 protein [Butyrivibrio sp.]